MTDVKALPENLEQLEQLTEFKRVYKKYTVDQLEDLLTEAEVDYLSADNKPDLVWRLLDYREFDFEAALAEVEQSNDEPQAEPVLGGDEPADEQPVPQDEPTDDKVDDNENVQTVQDDTSDEHGAQVYGEANTDTGSDNASTDDSEKPDGVADTADSDAPSDISNIDDASANEANQPAKTGDKAADSSSVPTDKAPTKTAVSELEYVEVKNNGGFNMLEPATGTLVTAGETTKVYIKGYATKEQVLRNITQYNHTRGNKLTITN